MNKGGISYAPEKEIRNVNIMYQTNIFVCGLLFKGVRIYADITVFSTTLRCLDTGCVHVCLSGQMS